MKYKAVFICPDRCPEEHTKHNNLVLELKIKRQEEPTMLKIKRQEEPTKRHFLKGGVVQTVDVP